MTKLKFKHEAKLVPINKIVKNTYNPNVMEPEIYAETVRNIRTEGFIYPLLVQQKKNNKYMIIDGFHRWKAAREVGYKELPVIVLDKDMPEAMIATINFNKLRGQFDTLRLAEVLHTLHETYSMEELEEKLGYTPEQIEGMENLLQYDFNSLSDEGVELAEGLPEEYEFKIMLTAKQNEIIEKAIETTGKENTAEALVVICLEYLTKHDRRKKS